MTHERTEGEVHGTSPSVVKQLRRPEDKALHRPVANKGVVTPTKKP